MMKEIPQGPIMMLLMSFLMLEGCKSLDRLAYIGDTPPLSRIQNPVKIDGYQPITMPMPAAQPPVQRVNSLWQSGARAFFKDQRANKIGDILTILVSISDSADIQSNTQTNRKAQEQVGVNNFLGLEQNLGRLLPKGANTNHLFDVTSNPQYQGSGTISRKETINLRIPASIIQVLPNGNFVISGRQEFRVNGEVRELVVMGVIRSEDITSINTIPYDKISEGRFSYGGRGDLDDQQRPRWGMQVLDSILPL